MSAKGMELYANKLSIMVKESTKKVKELRERYRKSGYVVHYVTYVKYNKKLENLTKKYDEAIIKYLLI